MLADLVTLACLTLGGLLLQKMWDLELVPQLNLGWLSAVLRSRWAPLLGLAVVLSLVGWSSRVAISGLQDTLLTAGGGPTETEIESCRKALRQGRVCPYGGEVTQPDVHCSLHGRAR